MGSSRLQQRGALGKKKGCWAWDYPGRRGALVVVRGGRGLPRAARRGALLDAAVLLQLPEECALQSADLAPGYTGVAKMVWQNP